MISFVINGVEPVAQPRPQVNGRTGKAFVDRGHSVHGWRDEVRLAARLADKGGGQMLGPILVLIKLRVAGSRIGDCDNYAKAILDAMEGEVFANDRQVATLVVVRARVNSIDQAGVSVTVADDVDRGLAADRPYDYSTDVLDALSMEGP